MPVLQVDSGDGLYYEWESARAADGLTFVFVNAITGDLGMWEAHIAPALRTDGHGTLAYNFRGQAKSPLASYRLLSDRLLVEDLLALLRQLKPSRPVLVGVCIGGLFAARVCAAGTQRAGLVLIDAPPAALGHMPSAPGGSDPRLADVVATVDWRMDCRRLALPVLLLSGLQDRSDPGAAAVAALARAIPGHRQVDLPPGEVPEAVLAALRGFAAELAA